MKFLKMPKEHLALFVSVLPAFGEVYAPVRRGRSHVFDRPACWSEVDLTYARTLLPPRKLFLPPHEVMFRFDSKTGYSDLLVKAASPRVLLGVHPYDILGLNILDRVFLEGPHADPYYAARRRHTAVIGIDAHPDARHFAASIHADSVQRGAGNRVAHLCDLFSRPCDHGPACHRAGAKRHAVGPDATPARARVPRIDD